MALDAYHREAFRHVANGIDALTQQGWFDTVVRDVKAKFSYNNQVFTFRKLGYSQLGSFKGIGYEIRGAGGGRAWVFWIVNPLSVAANKRALLYAIDTAVDDPNAGKLSWTVDASQFASA